MEEMYRTRYGERAQSLQARQALAIPLLSSVWITRKLSKPNFKFYGGLLKQAWMIKSLDTSDWSNSTTSLPWGRAGVGLKGPIFRSGWLS